jgi:uncharacterized repeat protein (TIGR01451 family)
MRKLRLVAITLAIAIALSPVSINHLGASGPLFKIFMLPNSSNTDYLNAAGVKIVETYDSFILGYMDPSLVPVLEGKGFQAVLYEGWDTVRVNGYTLKAGEYKLLMPQTEYPKELTWKPIEPSKSDYFVIQFHGPVKQEWTDELTSHGALGVSVLPENAVVVYMNYDSVRMYSEKSYVLGVSPYHPAFKIANGIKAGEDGLVDISISVFSNASIHNVMKTLPVTPMYDTANLDSGSARAKCPPENLMAIARHPSVSYIEEYAEPTVEMDKSREILGVSPRTSPISDYTGLPATTDSVWGKGLKGKGEVVCVQDTGLDSGNVNTLFTDFGTPARIVGHFGYSRTGPNNPPISQGPDPNQSKPWNDTHSHGTFTASQIVGDGRNAAGNQYAGIAPEAELVVQAGIGWLNPGLGDSYKLGARVHSNSWGSAMNVYNSSAQYLDKFVHEYPDMVVSVSAGNSGPSASTLGTPATAKNDICVGASGNNKPETNLTVAAPAGTNTVTVAGTANFASNQRVRIVGNTPAQDEFKTIQSVLWGPPRLRFTTTLAFPHNSGNIVYTQHPNSLANFSSRGPTSDNRIKPDLVAPGSLVMGVNLFRPPNYNLAQGTSMSCPNLAGTAVLTRQWLRTFEERPKPSAALVKALLINGARPIVEDYNGTAIQYYPNTKVGWGEVDLYNTLFPASPTVRKYYDVKSGISTGQRIDFPIVAGTGRFKATLVWSDYEGNPASSPFLVNDLDLVVTAPGNSFFMAGNQFVTNSNDSQTSPASRDNLNNVEGVFQTNLTQAGVYTVSVQGSNIPQGPQQFALVVEYQQTLPDFDVRCYPDTITVDTSFQCEQFKVRVSSLAGFQGNVWLDFSEIAPEFTAVFQTNPVWLGIGESRDVYFTLCRKSNLQLGKYYFKVRAKNGSIYHEDTLEVLVRPSKDYTFKFTKGVQIGGGIGSFGDNGKTVTPGQRLSYALNYDPNELNTFTNLYIDDVLPKNVTYNGNAFPLPTHYSLDNGATWINTKAPSNATNPIVLRWQLDQIIGSGRMTKPSTGTPGFDNVSNNVGSSQVPRSVIDSSNNIHIVWSDDTTGNPDDTEIFYSKFNRATSRWEDLTGNPGFSNISNDGGTFDEGPDIAIDANGYPHFTWNTYWSTGSWWPPAYYQIRYSRWNGTALVKGNGTAGYDILSQPIGDQYSQYMMPKIQVYGTNATVVFVNYSGWTQTQGVYLTRWNGTNWVRMNGTAGCDKIANNGWNFRPSGLTLGLDSTGTPHVVYTRERILFWWSFPDGMHAAKWTSALNNWTYFNSVNVGWENIFPTGSMNQYYPNLAMNGNTPHLAWADYVTRRWINYSRYVSGTWVDTNNNPGFYRVTNSTQYDDNLPFLTLQTNGQPAVAFMRVIGNVPEYWFTWYRSTGWTDLLGINQYENITEGINDSRYPSLVIDSDNMPYFVFQSGFSGNEEVYCTTPYLGWSTNNYPGQIVWEGKIDEQISAGVNAIINKAYMSGQIDTLEYQVLTNKTESSTTNPLFYGLSLRKTASSSQVKLGQEIKYTIKVSNVGAVPVEGIIVSDVLPHGMTFLRSIPSGNLSQNKVVWRIGTLQPGASEIFEVWCKITRQDLAGNIVTNDAYVTTSGGMTPIKASATVKVSDLTPGYPKTDYSIKVLTKNPKAGQPVQLEVKVWASNPPLRYTIEWGDGEKQSGNLDPNKPLNLEHTYNSAGSYKVIFRVFDRYDMETTSNLTINVE